MAIWDRLPPRPVTAREIAAMLDPKSVRVRRVRLMRAVAPRVQDIEASDRALAYRFGRK